MELHVIRQYVLTSVLLFAVAACDAEGMKNVEAGLRIRDQATAADVGLPDYPGAKPFIEEDDDSHAAKIDLATPLFGVKVVAVELEAPDAPAKVAAFYRDALAKYGEVVDCSAGVERRRKSSNGAVTCDDDDSDTDGFVYKVGTDDHQRVVAVEPHGRGSKLSLVHIDLRKD